MNGSVHHGMLAEWQSLRTCITESLTTIGCKGVPLRASGHSLGAGVVVLAMVDLKSHGGWDAAEIYNFGMPRLGDEAFRSMFEDMFKGRFYRVTHGRDPFVDLPAGPHYVHLEPEVFYKGDVLNGYVICHREMDKKCSSQYFPEGQNFMTGKDVAWHHKYMGVDTTQAGCLEPGVGCDDDIPDSWCNNIIPCNKDVRGTHVWCHKQHVWSLTGKCHCNPGYCPVAGKCVKKAKASIDAPTATTMGSPSPMSTAVGIASELPSSVVGGVVLLVSLLLGIFVRRATRVRELRADFGVELLAD